MKTTSAEAVHAVGMKVSAVHANVQKKLQEEKIHQEKLLKENILEEQPQKDLHLKA